MPYKPFKHGAEYQCGIYIIRNKENGKVYIGQASANIAHRWRQHRHDLRRGAHKNAHLQSAWDKYGEKVFEFQILEIIGNCDPVLLAERESYWIGRMVQDGFAIYNITPAGVSTKGRKVRDETKQRISQVKRAYWDDPEEGARRREAARKATIEANNKTYRLLSPDGALVETNCLKDFCQEHDLKFLQMSRMLNGRRPHYRGWRNANNSGEIQRIEKPVRKGKQSGGK